MNSLLPDVMNKLYTTNDQIHNHLQHNVTFFLHINQGHSNVYAIRFTNIISPRIWNALQKKLMLMCQ